MGIEIPASYPPKANYVNAVRKGNLFFMVGNGPKMPDGKYITGKVARDHLTVEESRD